MPALSGRKGEKRSAPGDFEVLAGGNEMGASKPVGLFDFAHRDPIDFCNLRESLARHHPVTGPGKSAFRNRDSLELARRRLRSLPVGDKEKLELLGRNLHPITLRDIPDLGAQRRVPSQEFVALDPRRLKQIRDGNQIGRANV